MTGTFCALPFKHLCIGPEGTARLCCVTTELVTEHGAPMSLNVHSMQDIWDSAYLRNVRHAMLKGERLSACEVCYRNEEACGTSYRMAVGSPTSIDQMEKYGAPTAYLVDRRPSFIKLEISNLCNLKCRMCFSAESSQIERDPVHSKWSGGDPLHAIWQGDNARIGPEPKIGVRTSGLFPHVTLDGSICRWTDGHAVFNVPIPANNPPSKLDVAFHPSGVNGQHLEIVVNGRPIVATRLRAADSPISVNLQEIRPAAELEIEIISSTTIQNSGERARGVPLSSMLLHRHSVTMAARPELISVRFGTGAPWYMDDRKIDEVLSAENVLDRLYITGGEPLINKRVIFVLDTLERRGAASRVDLEISTNCTHLDDSTIDLLKKFRTTSIYLSLDAVGALYEYIRYPARWDVIEANVHKIAMVPGLRCVVTPVIQAYNVLHLVELFEFCESLNLEFELINILRVPSELAIEILPPRIREIAAAKLVDYCSKGPAGGKKTLILALAKHLREMTTPADPNAIRNFMLFTNDLDATRRQDFRATHGDFVELLAQDGFQWIDDTLYANSKMPSTPARKRVYAWL